LLRRLIHWLMQEPELEDEQLTLEPGPEGLTIERSTLGQAPGPVTLINPAGARAALDLAPAGPGLWRAAAPADLQGLYEARSDQLQAFAAVGPLNPREALALAATGELMQEVAEATGGSVVFAGEDGAALPEIRRIEPGDRAAGDGWIGLRRNGAYVVRAASAAPLGPGLVWALLGVGLFMWSWRRETR
jgi:hypothetical protein